MIEWTQTEKANQIQGQKLIIQLVIIEKNENIELQDNPQTNTFETKILFQITTQLEKINLMMIFQLTYRKR